MIMPTIRIMTYNLGAIGLLIRESGERAPLKWTERARLLKEEIRLFSPDVLLLQEIDRWEGNGQCAELLADFGYESHVYWRSKPYINHAHEPVYGLVVAWKPDKIKRHTYSPFSFDNTSTDEIKFVTPITECVAQFTLFEYLHNDDNNDEISDRDKNDENIENRGKHLVRPVIENNTVNKLVEYSRDIYDDIFDSDESDDSDFFGV
jgi:Endonuclease/Exonuclease/phosphatase family